MNVLLHNAYSANHADRLRRLLTTDWTITTYREEEPPAAFAERLARASVLVGTRYQPGMPPAPKLKLIQSPAAGYDKMDEGAIPPGCVVCNVHEHETGISEYVMLAMLEWTIRLCRIDANFKRGSWEDGLSVFGPVHGEVWGKTVGIVGFGHIGREVARRADAFGMRIITVTRTPSKVRGPVDWAAGMDQLDAFLPQCDFVVLACPLTAETRGLMDARRLGLMKDSAVLINVARGEVADEDALYAALRDKVIRGATLDVWYNYPTMTKREAAPSRHPFHELPNVYMTPHCSAWTEGLFERRWRFIAANLDRFATGKPLKNVVIGRPKRLRRAA